MCLRRPCLVFLNWKMLRLGTFTSGVEKRAQKKEDRTMRMMRWKVSRRTPHAYSITAQVDEAAYATPTGTQSCG
jgi:hypothetical protein